MSSGKRRGGLAGWPVPPGVLPALVGLSTGLALLLACEAIAAVRSELVRGDLSAPVFAAAPAGDSRLFVVEREGLVRILDPAAGELRPEPFLDIRDRVSTFGERGLLGLAFPDAYPEAGFFVYYLNDAGESVVSRFEVSNDPDRAERDEAIALVVPQTAPNHNGGTIAFRDGWLYLALGDGGGGGDPNECAQDPETPLGKMLRLDPQRLPAAGIRVPFDPQTQSCPGPIPVVDPLDPEIEVWASGLRNPFRFSFDRATGDLWIGDVGQGRFEEIDFEPAGTPPGRNYGWDVMEASACFENDPALPPCGDATYTDPVHEYGRDQGRSVTGGVVYRGAIPELQGLYLFGDFATARIWSLDPGTLDVRERTAELSPSDPGGASVDSVVAFAEDSSGEVYVIDLGGQLFRIRTADPDRDEDGVPDALDVCPDSEDPAQSDTDQDGIGDACECGDFDRNGRVNTSDARLIQRCAVGDLACTGLCDANGDDLCDTTDARLVQRLAVGQLTKDDLRCAERPAPPG